MTNARPKTSLFALLVGLPLAAAPVYAESHTTGDTSGGSGMAQTEMNDAGAETTMDRTEMDAADSADDADGMAQDDPLVVTVAGTEIRGSDVERMMMAFPARVRDSQPVETLVPMAVDQLILRELILQEATAQNMADDEDVQQMASQNQQASEEDAMVQVYMMRELDSAVTDAAVQQVYDELSASSEGEVPPLDAVRPQIERQLRQERFSELDEALREGVEIVFYGPDGEPREASTASDTEKGAMDDGSGGNGSETTEMDDERESDASN